MIDWLANFLLIEVFPVWQNAITLGGLIVCFAALWLLAIVFVYRFLPETKGVPVEEIVRIFEQQQPPSRRRPAVTPPRPGFRLPASGFRPSVHAHERLRNSAVPPPN